MMTTDTKGSLDVSGKELENTKIASGLQVMKHIRSRRSIREFTGGRIPDEHIELILEAARHAPSPENMLMIRLIVIRDDQDTKEFLADIAQENAQTVFGSAPFELTSGRNWYIQDEFLDFEKENSFAIPRKVTLLLLCVHVLHGMMPQNCIPTNFSVLLLQAWLSRICGWSQQRWVMVAATRLWYAQTRDTLS